MIESMENADFSKIYDIQFQNTSALPDTKTGKIAAIIDLNMATQTDPIFRREDVVNMLDMGTEESFTERATFSLDSAKMIFDGLLQGKQVPAPEMHDDLIVYYTNMFNSIQAYQFKSTASEEIKSTIYRYIHTLEGLIYLKMAKNPKLAMEVQGLSYYPAFFELPAPIPAPAETMGTPQADLGEMKNAVKEIETAQTADKANQ
jgi:hypothetical protein